MIGATIDVTARTRIRALATRMHSAGIASVFSVAGGTPTVDESLLDPDQRAEAARIVEEVCAGVLKIEEVETASIVAVIVPHYVKPSCSICHGRGLVRRGDTDDICACVDRRWQAAVDRQAFVEGLRAPGRASGVRVESTREVDRKERIVSAKDALARARAAAAAACANLDAAIGALENGNAAYFVKREQIDVSRAGFRAQAEEQERLMARCADSVEEARARVEQIAIQIGQQLEPLLEKRSAVSDDERARTHTLVDVIYVAASGMARYRADQEEAKMAACWARGEERSCDLRIKSLDEEKASLVGEIERLRTERARIARHYQPKIDRAERRLRRLVYATTGVIV